MRKWIVGFALVCQLFQINLEATERRPWFGDLLVLEGRAKATANAYDLISTGKGTVHRRSCDNYLNLGASLAYRENLSYELEAIAENTSHDGFGMDSILFTVRNRWMNDITDEDPIALTTGLTVGQVFKPGLRNLSSFHHGGIEFEAHVAAGKEFSCMQFWMSRFWGVFGVGVADMGSPWIRANVSWEHNWWDVLAAEIYVRTLWGLGHNALNLCHTFRGYGPIGHQCVDLGVCYNYRFCNGFKLGFEYGYRVYGKNCPKGVNIVSLTFMYPFSL